MAGHRQHKDGCLIDREPAMTDTRLGSVGHRDPSSLVDQIDGVGGCGQLDRYAVSLSPRPAEVIATHVTDGLMQSPRFVAVFTGVP